MYKRRFTKADGRALYLYGQRPIDDARLAGPETPGQNPAHLRWHPLLNTWVIYAAHRQDRTFLPPAERCPLCPGHEIPFPHFEVAVFENRFPALARTPAPPPPNIPVPVDPGLGRAEVVVYTQDHEGSIASLTRDHRRLLVRVWVDRYQELFADEAVAYVMPFENRGEAVGVTLHHPHGQIYAYPFIPPVAATEADAFAERPVLLELLPRLRPYTIEETRAFVAFVPPFARFPYEVWIAPKRQHPGPWTFNEAELDEFADILGNVVRRYDALFAKPLPYVMALHAAPKGVERFHFHVEFYPPMRSQDKRKYLAGTELGAGTFVVDVLPETAAETLRKVL